MRNLVLIVFCLVFLFATGGCITTSVYEKERVDQELRGNLGYIGGEPPPVPVIERPKARKVYEVEIELPPLNEWPKRPWEDKEIWGNRGYIQGSMIERPPEEEEPLWQEKSQLSLQPEIVEDYQEIPEETGYPLIEDVPARHRTYRVKKADSLWNIAGYPEVYGDSLKWKKIYEANKDKIKDPDKIYPGQVLIIPE